MAERSGGGALKWIALGCGASLLLLACVGSAGFLACQAMFAEPEGQARGFFEDLRTGDFVDALARTDTTYQNSHTVEAFQVAVTEIPAATQQTGVSFTNRDVSGEAATMAGNLETPSGQIPVSVTLTRLGGNWYVSTVTIGGQGLR